MSYPTRLLHAYLLCTKKDINHIQLWEGGKLLVYGYNLIRLTKNASFSLSDYQKKYKRIYKKWFRD